MSHHLNSSRCRICVQRLSGHMTVLAALLITLVAPAAHASSGCNVVYTTSPQNTSQFGANITIVNNGSTALSNWVLTWTFANGQTIASSWNGAVSQSGANVTVSEQSGQTWENIPAGGSYSGFGFNGTWNGTTNSVPTNFAINGVACNGTVSPGSFTLKPSVSALPIAKGTSGTDTISVTDVSPFSGSVSLAASGLPTGVTATFGTNPTTGSSMVTFAASSSAAAATSTITITGTSGSLSATTTINLTVTGTSTGSFTLKPSASTLSIAKGAKGTETITITDVSPFSGSVTLAVSGLPSGVTAAFGSNPSNSSSLLTLTAGSAATAATSSITITGTSGSLSATTTISLTVTSIAVLAPGDHNETITSSGISRTFIVHIPTGYTGSTATPAIIDFHWYGAEGSTQEASSGWKQKCDSEGCIVVYPNSAATANPADSWDSGYCCGGVSDDTQFPRDIITWLKANTNLDTTRVYASGGSNGGAETYAMACWNSDVFAAVAAVDFRCVTGTEPNPGSSVTSLTPSNNTACSCPNLKRPITVVEWDEGEDYTFINYNGGVSSTGLPLVSALVNAETWADFDGCTGSATTDPNNSLCQTWTSCKDNTTVSLCTNPSPTHLAVYGNTSADWTGVTWDRLSTQSLPLP
jgi:poly(3-hydroxybutyrate) depolymerase